MWTWDFPAAFSCSRAALLSFLIARASSDHIPPASASAVALNAGQSSSCSFYTQAPTHGPNIWASLTHVVVSVAARCRLSWASPAPHADFNLKSPLWFGVLSQVLAFKVFADCRAPTRVLRHSTMWSLLRQDALRCTTCGRNELGCKNLSYLMSPSASAGDDLILIFMASVQDLPCCTAMHLLVCSLHASGLKDAELDSTNYRKNKWFYGL